MDDKHRTPLFDEVMMLTFGDGKAIKSDDIEKAVPRAPDPERRYVTGRWATRTRPPRHQPVHVTRADQRAWRAALDLTEGDTSRLTVEEDGSVTIHNHPVR